MMDGSGWSRMRALMDASCRSSKPAASAASLSSWAELACTGASAASTAALAASFPTSLFHQPWASDAIAPMAAATTAASRQEIEPPLPARSPSARAAARARSELDPTAVPPPPGGADGPLASARGADSAAAPSAPASARSGGTTVGAGVRGCAAASPAAAPVGTASCGCWGVEVVAPAATTALTLGAASAASSLALAAAAAFSMALAAVAASSLVLAAAAAASLALAAVAASSLALAAVAASSLALVAAAPLSLLTAAASCPSTAATCLPSLLTTSVPPDALAPPAATRVLRCRTPTADSSVTDRGRVMLLLLASIGSGAGRCVRTAAAPSGAWVSRARSACSAEWRGREGVGGGDDGD